jgi:chromosome segregation ATPase
VNLDLNAPSPWATGLTNRQAIRLADLRDQVNRGALALTTMETRELDKLEWLIKEAQHGVALGENADRDRARIAELEAQAATMMGVGMDRAAADAARVRELETSNATAVAQRDLAERARDALDAELTEVAAERDRIRAVAKTAQDQRETSRRHYAELRHALAELEDSVGPMRRTILELRAALAEAEAEAEAEDARDTYRRLASDRLEEIHTLRRRVGDANAAAGYTRY